MKTTKRRAATDAKEVQGRVSANGSGGARRPQAASAPGIRIGKSKIDGRGCFATAPFRKWQKIAELVGERISRVEAARRMRGRRRLHICAIDSYWGIDGSRGGNGSQFINHSCRPNCFLRLTRGHILFFALRDIAPGEEITMDYFNSYHPDDYRCRCGAPGCRGTINYVAPKPARERADRR
jgi:SET domain-containing protein